MKYRKRLNSRKYNTIKKKTIRLYKYTVNLKNQNSNTSVLCTCFFLVVNSLIIIHIPFLSDVNLTVVNIYFHSEYDNIMYLLFFHVLNISYDYVVIYTYIWIVHIFITLDL